MLLTPLILQVATDASPGLLKVPKVYNALVTSDQNLAPSRAYPVIQPVVHRTAIGYVPPFYYPQIGPAGPGFIGPDIIPLPHGPNPQAPEPTPTENPDAEQVEVNEKNIDATSKEKQNDDDNEQKNGNKERERVPLSFYPNYRSLYYNPYFYGYNPFPPVAPGNYYLDYQPRGPLVPVPPPPPPLTVPQPYPGALRSVANNQGERKKTIAEREERIKKIPDVPPPPVPTKRIEKSV